MGGGWKEQEETRGQEMDEEKMEKTGERAGCVCVALFVCVFVFTVIERHSRRVLGLRIRDCK